MFQKEVIMTAYTNLELQYFLQRKIFKLYLFFLFLLGVIKEIVILNYFQIDKKKAGIAIIKFL